MKKAITSPLISITMKIRRSFVLDSCVMQARMFGAFMRDAMVQNLAAQIGLDTQAQRPVLVFINGEYWGIHYLVESYNENYFTRHYGVDPKNLVVLEYEGIRRIGEEEDAANYQNMISELRAQDPKDEKDL